MSITLLGPIRPARTRLSWFRAWFRAWFRVVLAAVRQGLIARRRREAARRELLAADPRMLADLGISRAQAHFRALNGPLDGPGAPERDR
jgi:uncharacterized protein YjiS (DUF1127 family)